MSTLAIILAADPGSGFSGPKYLAEVGGEPLLQKVLNDVATWPVDDAVVVLGYGAEEIIETIDLGGSTIIIDPEWSDGSAAPLRSALDLASRDRAIDLCVVARGDQPGIDSTIVGSLIDAASNPSIDVAVPKYRYIIDWPVVLDHSVWEHLLGDEGSLNLHSVIASRSLEVSEVWFDHLPPSIYDSFDDIPRARR
ncbi:MAG: NTP transferase domain-containing protein [Actinomycetota bacterium]|nr:NTP transferase domain-containing protein [Actinomycetota bacterium]